MSKRKTKKKISKRKKIVRRKWSESKIKETFYILKKKDDDSWSDGVIQYILLKKGESSSPSPYVLSTVKEAGHLYIDNEGHITGSEVNQEYRGKGVGKFLYEQVLIDNKKLISSPAEASDQARRLHKSLMKKWAHKVDTFGEDRNEGDIIYYPKLKKEYQSKLKKKK